MTSAIRLDAVGVEYGGRRVLRDVSLEVATGEAVALLGPSGAGKSTLIGVINGTVFPSCGSVRVLGHDRSGLSTRAHRALACQVGTVHQDFCLVDELRVIHNVNAGQLGRWSTLRALCSLLWPLGRPAALAALERVGIAEKIFEKTATLSGGQQQRVAIARVLVQDPAIVLADEPISNLDPRRSAEIMALLRELCRAFGKTLVVSCHTVAFVHSHFDRVVGLREGTLRFQCAAAELTPALLEPLYRTDPEPTREAPRLGSAS